MPVSLPAITWEHGGRYCRFARRRALAVSFTGEAAPCYPLLHSYTCHIFDREKAIHKHILGSIHHESPGRHLGCLPAPADPIGRVFLSRLPNLQRL